MQEAVAAVEAVAPPLLPLVVAVVAPGTAVGRPWQWKRGEEVEATCSNEVPEPASVCGKTG